MHSGREVVSCLKCHTTANFSSSHSCTICSKLQLMVSSKQLKLFVHQSYKTLHLTELQAKGYNCWAKFRCGLNTNRIYPILRFLDSELTSSDILECTFIKSNVFIFTKESRVVVVVGRLYMEKLVLNKIQLE